MGVLQDLENGYHDVTHQLSSGLTHYVSPLNNPVVDVFQPTLNPYVDIAGGGIGLGILLGGGGAAAGAGGAAVATGAPATAQATTASSLYTSIAAFVTKVSTALKSFLDPISKVINETTGIVQKVNDELIKPVQNIITATHTDVHDLVTAFHTDLRDGLRGLVKLPGDIANSLTSLDATFQRSQQQLATLQKGLITDDLVPGLNDGIGGPLKGIDNTLATPIFNKDNAAAFENLTHLYQRQDKDSILKGVTDFEEQIAKASGLAGEVARVLWGILKTGDLVVAEIQQQIEIVSQYARQSNPVSLLSQGETIEALRRGLIDSQSAYDELSKQGIDTTRQKVLYDLAQFLFGPKDAVNLRARNIIDDKTLSVIMDQNNLDSGQVDSLTQLMQHILGPGDIAAAQARGYIDSKISDEMYAAALIPDPLRFVISQLEQTLVDPKLMTALHGRVQATADQWLGGYLDQKAPKEVADQFDRAQAEDGTADLAWLSHWRIPGPEWWVDAYFRGLRTLTEVEQAFRANNVPEAIWPDIFGVEEELPPVWLIPDIIASGVWNEAQAIPQFRKLGFSEENAKVLYDYGFSKSKASKAQTAGDLQKVSLSNAATMFDDGIIKEHEYVQVLLDHGYSQDAANLTVELAKFKEAMAQINQAAQDVINSANLGQIDDATAESDLYNLGMTDTQVNKWLLKLHKARAAKAKHLTLAELKKARTAGLITDQQWLTRVVAMGYSEADAQILFEID